MRILIAPDKFKGSLSAKDVCNAIVEGIRLASDSLLIKCVPMADGGEGTSGILTSLTGGRMLEVPARDPLGRPINGKVGFSPGGHEAFIEMSSVSGLALLSDHERNPAYTSTVGTGDLILAALSANAKKIVLGIGGSSTHDAGTGMASALGVRFLDRQKKTFVPVGATLKDISQIDFSTFDKRIRIAEFVVLCDVTNPLYGTDGAARVFAAQKGADDATILSLDEGTKHFAGLIKDQFDQDVNIPGAGAAGGVGAGALFFLNARLRKGIDFMIEFSGLESEIISTDLVITGEGHADHQTFSGKVVHGVAGLCRKHSKKLWLVAGRSSLTEEDREALGISRSIALVNSGIPEHEAVTRAYYHLKRMVCEEFRRFVLESNM
jgi:glycerate 2-kinase